MTAVGYAQPVNLDKVTKLVAQFGQVRLARRLEDATPPKSLDERRVWVSRVGTSVCRTLGCDWLLSSMF